MALLYVADRVGTANEFFASVSDAVAQTGMNRKTIIAELQRLVRVGVLDDTGARKGKTGQIKVWRFQRVDDLPKRIAEDAANGTADGTVSDDGNGTADGTVSPGKSTAGGHESVPSAVLVTVPLAGHGTKTGTKTRTKPSDPSLRSGSAAVGDSGDAAKDVIFLLGVPLLVDAGRTQEQARKLLAAMCKGRDVAAVACAVQEAVSERVVDPVSWLLKQLPIVGTRPAASAALPVGAAQLSKAGQSTAVILSGWVGVRKSAAPETVPSPDAFTIEQEDTHA